VSPHPEGSRECDQGQGLDEINTTAQASGTPMKKGSRRRLSCGTGIIAQAFVGFSTVHTPALSVRRFSDWLDHTSEERWACVLATNR